MKHIFTRLFSLLLMAAISMGAMADTAVLSWYMGTDGAAATSANSITGASGCAAEGFTIAITSNDEKAWSNGNGDITYGGNTYKTLKNANGWQNTVTLPDGKYASKVEFYVTSNADASGKLSEFNGETCDDEVSSQKNYANPTHIEKTLTTPANSFTFTFSTKQVCFIMVVTYTGSSNPSCAEPVIVFGRWSDADNGYPVTITNNEDGATLTYAIGEGEYQAYSASFYVGSKVTVHAKASKDGYDDTVVSSTAPKHGDATATFAWLVGNEASATITSDKDDCVDKTEVSVGTDLTVNTYSKYDANNGNTMVTYAPSTASAGNVAGVMIEYSVEMLSGVKFQLKSVAYDAIKDGTDNASYSWSYTVDGTESAITTVSKDDLLRNSNTSGTPPLRHEETITASAGQKVTVRFYVSGFSSGKKFALSNIEIEGFISGDPGDDPEDDPEGDDPEEPVQSKVFGVTRAVASETSTASDDKTTAYKLSEDALVDAEVEGVTVTMNYGSQSEVHNKVRTFTWHNGTEAITCYTENGEKCYRVSSETLDEDLFYGFDITAEPGKKISLVTLVSDVLIESGRTGLHYQVKIFNGEDALATFDAVDASSTGINMKRSIDLSENADLQDLTGTVSVKMFIYGGSGTGNYINLKDLNVAAQVEDVEGEGVSGLVFTDFTASAHPSFTEGDVTAVWSNSANDVKPATENRGIRVQYGYDYTMQLTVPSDSYISEVVFVWNKKGNKNAGYNDDYYIDFTVFNSSDVAVSSLQAADKVDETVWSCGAVRESVLKFVQGAGDFYCHSIRVTYLKKPATLTYTRTHSHMNLNTLCYPYAISSYTGATFYTMLYKTVDGSGDALEVVLQEHAGALEAGKPYFYVPSGTELVCRYSGNAAAAGDDGNGVYGSYTDYATVTSGMYVTYNNQIVKAGDNVKLREYRAYINMAEVNLEGNANPVPGRRLLRIGNADAPKTPTDVESNQQSAISSQKIIRDGQLYLMYEGRMYDVQGRVVK